LLKLVVIKPEASYQDCTRNTLKIIKIEDIDTENQHTVYYNQDCTPLPYNRHHEDIYPIPLQKTTLNKCYYEKE